MKKDSRPSAIVADDIQPRTTSNYPPVFAEKMAGRFKRALGDVFGISNFGVNLTRLAPGSMSSLRHAHSRQDEFIYILEGQAVLRSDEGEALLKPGMCAGFKAATGNAHHIVNRGEADVVYLEIGDRSSDDSVSYPDDDIQATLGSNGKWEFRRKDGRPYE
jgi:uncharacterized cupin superfamily protein